MKKKLLIVVISLLVVAYLISKAITNNDFYIYMHASTDLFKGTDIYTALYKGAYHYFYSVLFAILIFPLSYLPMPVAMFIWLVANVFFFYRIIKILEEYLNLASFSQKQKWLLFILCFAFGLEFTLTNFSCGQATILILYLSLEGIRFIHSGNKISGALLIALGINIKLLPVVLLPYLLYRREFKASAWIVVMYAVLLFLPALILGVAHNNMLLASWWHIIDPMNTNHIMDEDEASFHSLSTLLSTLLIARTYDSHSLPIKRNIANISVTQLAYVLNIVRLFFISLSFYFFRTRPFVSIKNKMHQLWEISYLLLLVPLIFPHQQIYAFLFIMPAVVYIIYYLMINKGTMSGFRFKLLVTACSLCYLACNISFLLGEYNGYYVHFKILTYGALLVIPILAACVPDIREPENQIPA